jgi:hypothetical protein
MLDEEHKKGLRRHWQALHQDFKTREKTYAQYVG